MRPRFIVPRVLGALVVFCLPPILTACGGGPPDPMVLPAPGDDSAGNGTTPASDVVTFGGEDRPEGFGPETIGNPPNKSAPVKLAATPSPVKMDTTPSAPGG